jgi:hypothetical protein
MYEYAIGFKLMHLRSHPGGINRSVISIADEIADRGGGTTIGEMVRQSLEGKFLDGLATIGKCRKTRCPHKWYWRKGIHVKGIAPSNSVRLHIMHNLVSVSRIAVLPTGFGICRALLIGGCGFPLLVNAGRGGHFRVGCRCRT